MNKCVHYWIIEFPNGGKSTGVCKICKTTRSFYNSYSDTHYNNVNRHGAPKPSLVTIVEKDWKSKH